MKNFVEAHSLLTDFDISLFRSGKHFRMYEKFGAHVIEVNGQKGTYFAVWAPNAESVSVIGNFNFWSGVEHQLHVRWDSSGIWEGFIPNLTEGEIYKYRIKPNGHGEVLEKCDPFAKYAEIPPNTASIIWNQDYKWKDTKWMKSREKKNGLNQPYSVYEVHIGSWKRKLEEGGRSLTYKELAEDLVGYVKEHGFTHVELMPVMHHPFTGSWGYQITGYYAPVSDFGSPQDFMALVDAFHKAEIGVILDWVPSHFPGDAHGLKDFDGTALYEHADPRKGYHPDWESYIFNYGRNEVKSFLISNAAFWFDVYHADGLRVDAVASLLYLDYSRKEGEWIPNEFGGRENLEAISFMKEMNEEVYKSFEGIQTIAEESTAWPSVSRPTYLGGLGFGMKWMMGWMHDTLRYFKYDSFFKKYHHNEISFSLTYAFTENFMLPLSHDEVVHGKGALIDRMPGDEWQKFANLRMMYTYMFTHPGTKLLFMGAEFGQTSEWNHNQSLDWHLTQYAPHKGVQALIKDLNSLYKKEKALFENSFTHDGFEWIDYGDNENTVLSYMRKGKKPSDFVIVVCNFTPVLRENYKIGVPVKKNYKEVFNSDDKKYWGSDQKNKGLIKAENISWQGKPQSISLNLPPLGIVVLKVNTKD